MGKFGFLSSLVFLFPAWMLTATAGTNLETGPETGFRNYFALELEGSASYYLFTLTPEVHQANMTPNGRDLRIVDADGNPAPYAFGGNIEMTEETPKEAPKELSLRPAPWFPLPRVQSGKKVKVQDGFIIAADGTLRVRERQAELEQERRSGDIVDLSGIAAKDGENVPWINALFVRIGTPAKGTGDYLGTVEVLASDDLQSWSPITTAQLLRLDHRGQRLERERIDFDGSLPSRLPRYLQLLWHGAPPVIASIEVELLIPQGNVMQPQPRRQAESRYWQEKLPGQMPPGGDVFFDTGGVFPVDRLRFHLPRLNTVVPVKLYSRASEDANWQLIHAETLYRLRGPDGSEQETPEIRIAPNRNRLWKMTVESDGRNNGTGNPEFGGTPLLSIGWRPETITFLARGTPPFLLAVGNAQATDASIPLARLLIGDKPYLATAQVGIAQPPPANAPTIPSNVASLPQERQLPLEERTRRYILWGVLLATVALLAFMARKVAKNLPQEGAGDDHR